MVGAVGSHTFGPDMIGAVGSHTFCPDMISAVGSHLTCAVLRPASYQCAGADFISTIRCDCGRCGLAINSQYRACGGRFLRLYTYR
ncbi:hypothetical protein D9M71_746250 [compost metagenome]